jgi:IS4 transposase
VKTLFIVLVAVAVIALGVFIRWLLFVELGVPLWLR